MSATPGPWSVDYLDKHSQRVVSGPHFEIATLWHHSVGAIEQEMEANAALVAAAPEMLAALTLGILARTAQKRYFKTRNRSDLTASFEAEKAFDAAALAALAKAEATL